MKYKIGIKNGCWKIITDGDLILQAKEDLRWNQLPPLLYERFTTYESLSNDITKMPEVDGLFKKICDKNNYKIKSQISMPHQFFLMILPITIGIALIYIKVYFIFIILAVWISWSFARSDFSLKNIESVFQQSKLNADEWNIFFTNKKVLENKKKVEELSIAQKKWAKYFEFKSMDQIQDMTGNEFESFVANLYDRKGYESKITKKSGDYGVDVIARKGKEVLAIQTKRYKGSVGIKAVQEVLAGATFYKATKAIVITNSFFTMQAKELARRTNVKLINKVELAKLLKDFNKYKEVPDFDLKKYNDIEWKINRELYRLKKIGY